jgi:type VI secretion system secreted protein Hcp
MAAVDYFLKIDGIPGEAQDKTHKDEIQLESWSFGESQGGTFATGGGGGAGKVVMQDFHFVQKVNKSSPLLFKACATGEHIGSATLTCRKAGKEQQEFYKVTFTDLLVASFQIGGSGGSDVIPMEQIALNFTKIELAYKEQDAKGQLKGAVKAWYDLKKQEGG